MYNYYIRISDKPTFDKIMNDLINEGCHFQVAADANNRPDKFISASFHVVDIGCEEYKVIARYWNIIKRCPVEENENG